MSLEPIPVVAADMDESRLHPLRWARDGRPIAATIRAWVDENLQ